LRSKDRGKPGQTWSEGAKQRSKSTDEAKEEERKKEVTVCEAKYEQGA
jgi:hypothetical protein